MLASGPTNRSHGRQRQRGPARPPPPPPSNKNQLGILLIELSDPQRCEQLGMPLLCLFLALSTSWCLSSALSPALFSPLLLHIPLLAKTSGRNCVNPHSPTPFSLCIATPLIRLQVVSFNSTHDYYSLRVYPDPGLINHWMDVDDRCC